MRNNNFKKPQEDLFQIKLKFDSKIGDSKGANEK